MEEDLDPSCLTQRAVVERSKLDPKSLEYRVFVAMCRTSGPRAELRGLEQASSLRCVRNSDSGFAKDCGEEPHEAMAHMANLVCMERWYARVMMRRAPDLAAPRGSIAEDERETPYPGLHKLIEEKSKDKDACASLRDELERYRRKQQGL